MVSRRSDGTLGVSIIDPHGDYLADTRPKLQALARYAELYGDHYVRIESIVKVGDQLRVKKGNWDELGYHPFINTFGFGNLPERCCSPGCQIVVPGDASRQSLDQPLCRSSLSSLWGRNDEMVGQRPRHKRVRDFDDHRWWRMG